MGGEVFVVFVIFLKQTYLMAVTNTKGGVKVKHHQLPSLKCVFHFTVSGKRAQKYLYNPAMLHYFVLFK